MIMNMNMYMYVYVWLCMIIYVNVVYIHGNLGWLSQLTNTFVAKPTGNGSCRQGSKGLAVLSGSGECVVFLEGQVQLVGGVLSFELENIYLYVLYVLWCDIYLTTRWFGYSPDTDRMSFSFGGIGTKLLLEATKIRTWRYQHVIQFEIILANVGFPMISKEWQYVGWLSKLTHKRNVAWNPTDRPRSSKWRSSWETVL